jgi:hypothetical protein
VVVALMTVALLMQLLSGMATILSLYKTLVRYLLLLKVLGGGENKYFVYIS